MNTQKNDPSQGDVIWIDLDKENPLGHEEQGRRPVLVISNDSFNHLNGGIVKAIPITTSSHQFPYHIDLPKKAKVKGKVMIDQEREIDIKARHYKFYCHLPDSFVKKIIEILLTSF